MDKQQTYVQYLESTSMMVNPPSFETWLSQQETLKNYLTTKVSSLQDLINRFGDAPEVSGKVNG